MQKRINFYNKGQEAVKHLFATGQYLEKSSIEKNIQELIM
ncbi:hypothetical protein SAMN05660841_03323 [Sphingobacterium nematocida]|uniref:Uncharacterized protein n=1 Tax=Sphingobacterium nematocida TaxID=1513896 RepID=A0A1T5FKG6_9SPHI|nr:hypothetical protein SAMN05660841_03323 [Sphingobacterium nematocida]